MYYHCISCDINYIFISLNNKNYYIYIYTQHDSIYDLYQTIHCNPLVKSNVWNDIYIYIIIYIYHNMYIYICIIPTMYI